jgi:pentatricopeptide repeat protein
MVSNDGYPLVSCFQRSSGTYPYHHIACAKAKMWKKALELLDEMQQNGIAPTEVTYSVAISACGNGGQWRKALGLLELVSIDFLGNFRCYFALI